MTLPASGLITMAQINVELGRAATAALSLNDPACRLLAGRPTGQINMSDFWGKTTQFKTTFDEYAAGAQPSDWTKRWLTGYTAIVTAVAGSLSGKLLRWTKTTADRGLLSWNAIPAAADVEILMRCRSQGSFTVETFTRVLARGSGATGAENAYQAAINSNNGSNTHYQTGLVKFVGGTGTNIGTPVFGPAPAYVNGDWMWVRFDVTGNVLSQKIWKDGTAEPGAYQTVIADNDLAAGGWVGILNNANGPNMDIDHFSVGILGRPAPS